MRVHSILIISGHLGEFRSKSHWLSVKRPLLVRRWDSTKFKKNNADSRSFKLNLLCVKLMTASNEVHAACTVDVFLVNSVWASPLSPMIFDKATFAFDSSDAVTRAATLICVVLVQ